MTDESHRPKGRDGVLSSLDVAIDGLNLAKEISSITPAKVVFGSVAILLTMIRVSFLLFHEGMLHGRLTHNQDSMANEADYIELGLSCADICRALERGMNGKKLSNLSKSVCEAVNQLTT